VLIVQKQAVIYKSKITISDFDEKLVTKPIVFYSGTVSSSKSLLGSHILAEIDCWNASSARAYSSTPKTISIFFMMG
jgi:hypothetical protein